MELAHYHVYRFYLSLKIEDGNKSGYYAVFYSLNGI